MIKITLKFLIVLILTSTLCAQDQHFSQYHNAPLFVNPAHTGFFIGTWRAGAAYRNQWRTVDIPFETYSVFFDKKFDLKTDRVGAGLVLVSDVSGPAGLTFTKAYASGAYSKIHSGHMLTLGFQPGVVHQFVSEDATFPDQYNPETGTFEPTVLTQEDLGNLRTTYFDMNTGLLWNYRSRTWSMVTGLAIAHLNQPNESFIDAIDARLPRKIIAHGAFIIAISERVGLSPSVLYARHNRATEFLVGGWMDLSIGPDYLRMGLKFGASYRNNTRSYADGNFTDKADAISTMAGFRWQDLDFGLSYDVNISTLNVASRSRGAFELTLVYYHGSEDDDFGKDIPCWRY